MAAAPRTPIVVDAAAMGDTSPLDGRVAGPWPHRGMVDLVATLDFAQATTEVVAMLPTYFALQYGGNVLDPHAMVEISHLERWDRGLVQMREAMRATPIAARGGARRPAWRRLAAATAQAPGPACGAAHPRDSPSAEQGADPLCLPQGGAGRGGA